MKLDNTLLVKKTELQEYLKMHIHPQIKVLKIENIGDDPTKLLRINNAILIECIIGQKKQKYIFSYPKENISEYYLVECIKNYFWQTSTSNKNNLEPEFLSLGYVSGNNLFKTLDDFKSIFSIQEFVDGKCYADIISGKSKNNKPDKEDIYHANCIVNYFQNRKKVEDKYKKIFYFHDTLFLIKKTLIIIDNLYRNDQISGDEKFEIENKIIEWHQEMQKKNRPVVISHNDFHPWNILFTKDNDLKIIDRDFPGYSEPARDLGTLLPNFLYFAFKNNGAFTGMCKEVSDYILTSYIEKSKDNEILEVIQPYLAMTCFILSNNQWYPDLDREYGFYLKKVGMSLLHKDSISSINDFII